MAIIDIATAMLAILQALQLRRGEQLRLHYKAKHGSDSALYRKFVCYQIALLISLMTLILVLIL